jgi:hypothetical protein
VNLPGAATPTAQLAAAFMVVAAFMVAADSTVAGAAEPHQIT